MMLSFPQSECFLNITQEFLVCTTIHKAKNLAAFNVDTYVKVNLEKKSKNTKVFKNSENPYYNELSCTLAELLRFTVLYEVKKRTCCASNPTLGELLIDLQTVWNQPHRSFFKKWGKLENSIGRKGEPRGHLQIDLAIVSPNQPTAPVIGSSADCDDIESNLLQSLNTAPCNIKYIISFYKGAFVKKMDYILQVSLAGINGKTSKRKGSAYPEWNEEVQFNWTHPSLAQTFLVQVMGRECLQWRCVAETEIYFDEISFNATPSLGPTFIHFYDLNAYVGRVLMEIESEKLNAPKESINRTFVMKPMVAITERTWWVDEPFVVEFLIWQGEFVHANFSNMKVSMKLGELTSDSVECFLKNYSGTTAPFKYFTHSPPFKAIHIKCTYPDNRLKYESDHFMITLVEQMNSEMENFKLFQLKYPQNQSMHCKCLKAIIISILSKVQETQSSSRLYYNGFKQQTVWDENRLVYIREFFLKFTKSLKELRQNLKTMKDGELSCDKVYQELQQLRGQIEAIIQTRIQDEWPELQLFMYRGSGTGTGKEFAICKLNPRHFIYSQRSECNGRWSGIPRNFVFKDTSCTHSCKNCGCINGFLYGWLRIATETEQNEFSISEEWEQKERFYYKPRMEDCRFICRLYIHQAKIQPGADKSRLCNAKVKVFFGEEIVETPTVFTTLSPVWNASVSFALRKMPGALMWYEKNPPLLAVQVYDVGKNKSDDYLGCGLIELSVQSIAHRQDPLQPIMENTIEHPPPEGCDDTLGRFRSKSAVGNLMKFIKTRVALQTLKELKFLSPPLFKWVPIANVGAARVEVLMSGELLQVEGESPDGPKAVLVKGMPKDIQPVIGRYFLEVTFIGLRNCQKLCCCCLGRYKIHLMMGELLLKSGRSGSRLKNSINFLENYASGIVDLPEQFEYWPAIIATHIDCPGRRREVTLGATLVSNPSKYFCKKETTCDFEESIESTVIQVGEEEADEENAPLLPVKPIWKKSVFVRFKECFKECFTRILPHSPVMHFTRKNRQFCPCRVEEAEYNWWTKFYNSMYMQENKIESSEKHKLVIYGSELEKEADFSFLSDWAGSFNLVHGVKIKKNKPPQEETYATLKMHIKLTQCHCTTASTATLNSMTSKMSTKFQTLNQVSELTKVVVRVYLVQGLQFRSQDAYSQSDSYVKLQLGSHSISDRAHYVPNQSNPIFGKRFQMKAVIPREHILKISVFNRGCACDDLIGSTFIDIEDRLRSKHRATVGISNEFNRSGYNMWRDKASPYDILRDICKKNNVGPPLFERNRVELEGVRFEDTTVISIEEDLHERLSLSVLKNIQNVPSINHRIVPEHVETRSLYREERPGIEQGKLQLWVEIFDVDNVPPPIDITPTPPRMYELRLIVYNCSEVFSNEQNVFKTKMSDIYIKAWCEDSEAYQSTDVHYRSLTGEGNFNWRMIFPIKYSNAEDMMVIKRKSGMLEQCEVKHPPIVYLQIWENDALSADDFMCALEICLSKFQQPFDNQKLCTNSQVKKKRKSVNLFREKCIKGWFPCKGPSSKGNTFSIAGKVELKLEILSESEAAAKPAGRGRNPPNSLPAPERPEASLNSPLKAFKHIFGSAKWCLCICVLVAIIIVLMLLFGNLSSEVMDFIETC